MKEHGDRKTVFRWHAAGLGALLLLGSLLHFVFAWSGGSPIVAFFYTYTALAGRTILVLDIGSFVGGAVLCQLLSFRILTADKARPRLNTAALVLLVAHGACMMIFTFRPPRLPLFRDFVTGRYGIEAAR